MNDTIKLAASAMGRKSAQKRHKRILAEGGDISEYYRKLRKKPNKIKVLTNVPE
jgi:hypothetical protein